MPEYAPLLLPGTRIHAEQFPLLRSSFSSFSRLVCASLGSSAGKRGCGVCVRAVRDCLWFYGQCIRSLGPCSVCGTILKTVYYLSFTLSLRTRSPRRGKLRDVDHASTRTVINFLTSSRLRKHRTNVRNSQLTTHCLTSYLGRTNVTPLRGSDCCRSFRTCGGRHRRQKQ